MVAVSHLSIGFASVLMAGAVGVVDATPAMIAGGLIGAVLPDIDCRNSFIGRRVYPIAAAIEAAFGHRGMFHSPLFWLAILGPALLITRQMPAFVVLLGMSIGVVSHLFADWQTNGGIPLFWPAGNNRCRAPWAFSTGSFIEVIIVGIVTAMVLLVQTA